MHAMRGKIDARTPFAVALCMAAALLAGQAAAQSQAWPVKAVYFIVSTSPSTASDIIARTMAARLNPIWKQAIVVDNRTGAGGAIAMSMVAKSPTDGYNILFTANTITMIGALNKNIDWDVERSFTPLTLIARTVTVALVNADLPVKSAAEMLELAKSRPGQLNYASPGVGTPQHLLGELFKHTYSVDLLHVPYKTSAAAITDLAAGRAQVGFFALGTVMPMVKAGKLRVLAASGDQRSSFIPNVPTFTEAGLGKIQASNWVGTFVAPATPNETAERIASHFTTLLADVSFQQELLKSELVPNASGAGRQEFSATVKADTARWKKVVADANIVTE